MHFQIYPRAIVRLRGLSRVTPLLVFLEISESVTVSVLVSDMSKVAEVLQLPPIRQSITIRIDIANCEGHAVASYSVDGDDHWTSRSEKRYRNHNGLVTPSCRSRCKAIETNS